MPTEQRSDLVLCPECHCLVRLDRRQRHLAQVHFNGHRPLQRQPKRRAQYCPPKAAPTILRSRNQTPKPQTLGTKQQSGKSVASKVDPLDLLYVLFPKTACGKRPANATVLNSSSRSSGNHRILHVKPPCMAGTKSGLPPWEPRGLVGSGQTRKPGSHRHS